MSYYIVYPLAWLFGLLPYKVQFLLSDVVCLVLYRFVRYRRRVVTENLRRAFPEKSSRQRNALRRQFYIHLADVCIESLSMASVSRKQVQKRLRYLNLDQVEHWTDGGSFLSAMAHYGSWEYTVNYPLVGVQDDTLAVYKPLGSKGIDRYYRAIRSRFGAIPVPMREIGREVVERGQAGRSIAVALIADQSPGRIKNPYWLRFMGQQTPFHLGMEKMALKWGIPVLFLHMDKVCRGHYEARFELIYDGSEFVTEGEITRRYAERLEAMIRRRPELWMWSHRRWRYSKEE